MKSYKIFAPLIDLFKKKEVYNKSDKIIYNGENNDYAEKVELFIENSITATSSSNVFKRFLIGLGDHNLKDFAPNKYQKFDEFLDKIAEDYKDHRGFAILVKYNPLGEKKEFHNIAFTDVRIEKSDSNEEPTRYILCKNWNDITEVKKSEKYPYHVYNDNPKIVLNQIEKEGFDKYKGQIFYWHGSKEKYHYPISFIHSVMNDADTEHRIQIHRNKRIRGGMLNKKIIVTPPSIPDHLTAPDNLLNDLDLALKKDCINKKTEMDELLSKFVSAENNEGLLHIEMQYDGDDMEKMFKVIDFKAESEDGFFKDNENTIKKNIRACYFNIPPILIDSENSFFGSSGEAINELKEFYEQNVKPERIKFERALSKVLSKEVKIVPLVGDVNIGTGTIDGQPTIQRVQNEAAATLRGTVGGVEGILSIQLSVSQGVTTYEGGKAILMEIYDFTEEKATQILGNKNELTNNSK
jgi:hypothetical protein